MPALHVVTPVTQADNNNIAEARKLQVPPRINRGSTPPADQSRPRNGRRRRFSISRTMIDKAPMDILEGIQATSMLSKRSQETIIALSIFLHLSLHLTASIYEYAPNKISHPHITSPSLYESYIPTSRAQEPFLLIVTYSFFSLLFDEFC